MKYRLSEKYLLSLLDILTIKLSSKVTLNSLAKETDLKSHTVVARYLEYLEAAYAVHMIYQFDLNKKRALMRKEKKIYFADPFIFHASRTYIWAYRNPFKATIDWLSQDENRSKLVENIVAINFVRKLPPEPWRRIHLITYYAENSEGDFITRLDGEFVTIEVKWREKEIKPSKTQLKISSHLKSKNIIVTRDKFKITERVTYVPAPLIALL